MDPRSLLVGARVVRRLPTGQAQEGVVSSCALDANNECIWTVRRAPGEVAPWAATRLATRL